MTVGAYRVYVYREKGVRRHVIHCHVYWPDGSCVVDIDTMELLAGADDARARQIVRDYLDAIVAKWNEVNS